LLVAFRHARCSQGDQQFDARLFNQSGGMSSGFGDEADYTVYSKPLFDRGEAASVYRPKRDAEAMAEVTDNIKITRGHGRGKRQLPTRM
jgi:SNW domain-containing protein 1